MLTGLFRNLFTQQPNKAITSNFLWRPGFQIFVFLDITSDFDKKDFGITVKVTVRIIYVHVATTTGVVNTKQVNDFSSQ